MGTSSNPERVPLGAQDHPHACGDKSVISSSLTSMWGSSPRVWGQDRVSSTLIQSLRIIPTRVGTRKPSKRQDLPTQDHPHACGDKVCENYYAGDGVGSSPRVWGQESRTYTQKVRMRIIPTRVGTRVFANADFLTCEDHPHACGDKLS